MPAEVETMFYHGQVPWHGLGTKLDHPATAEEAIQAAGLDWQVSAETILDSAGDPIPGYKAIFRNTDRRVYQISKDRYKPIQNQEAFQFFDGVVGAGQAIYHTAGALRHGARIWMLAKLERSMLIRHDQVDQYVVLSNSHDGTTALQMYFTPIRVVCMNTLRMAENAASAKFYARHTPNCDKRMEQAREMLGIANEYFRTFTEQANYLASRTLPAPEMPLLLKAAFGYDTTVPMEMVYQPVQRAMERVEALYEGEGKGLDAQDIRGTKWAAYNAVVEYVDYERPVRADEDDKGARLQAAWFGAGYRIKDRAWQYLLRQ